MTDRVWSPLRTRHLLADNWELFLVQFTTGLSREFWAFAQDLVNPWRFHRTKRLFKVWPCLHAWQHTGNHSLLALYIRIAGSFQIQCRCLYASAQIPECIPRSLHMSRYSLQYIAIPATQCTSERILFARIDVLEC